MNTNAVKDEINSFLECDSVQHTSSYYVANFKHVVRCVLENDRFKLLFDEKDLQSVVAFKALSECSQKLYVRLFQRKFKWHRPSKISYPEIATDLSHIFEDLTAASLVESDSQTKVPLEEVLELLSLPEMKILSKHFNSSFTGKCKQEMLQSLLKLCHQYKAVFFSSGNISETILKKAKQILGPCYRLTVEPKRTFTRILMLFSLANVSDDGDNAAAGGQQRKLITLLMVNKGDMKFPECKITQSAVIFQNKSDLVWFEEAKQLEVDILNAVEKKEIDIAETYFKIACKEYGKMSTSSHSRNSTLPSFLKRYTAGHVYIRSMSSGVEILQKLRKYEEAVKLLQLLLNQTVYCQDYRSNWWDRISLNLMQHLKKPKMAMEEIKKSLNDSYVRGAHRFNLLQRAHRLLPFTNESEAFKMELHNALDVLEAPKVVIKGRLFPHAMIGQRHAFIFSNQSSCSSNNETDVLNVEDLSLEHYKSVGFSEGIHGESSTFISLYGLLFWDIIYDDSIPDAFISPYQSEPMDINTDCYYQSREIKIKNHLEAVKKATPELLQRIVAKTWSSHYGETSLVNWERFQGLDQVQGLLKCLGNSVICDVCARFCKDFRHSRSGFPDLVVWNSVGGNYKIVEVKGPNDKLSSKQILWIDFLRRIGANVELCFVEAVGSKKLKSKS